MRRVIGRDDVDGTVGERRMKRLDIGVRAQRRRHFGVGAEARERAVVEHEVMRRRLAGDVSAALARRADQLDALSGRDVRDMYGRTGADGDREVATHAMRFGGRRNAGDAETFGDFARIAARRDR